jgi:hypothetical protein
MTLLGDKEWAKWSDSEIARRVNVSHEYVGQLRPTTVNVDSEKTCTTKHGTVATMDTSNIGRGKGEPGNNPPHRGTEP